MPGVSRAPYQPTPKPSPLTVSTPRCECRLCTTNEFSEVNSRSSSPTGDPEYASQRHMGFSFLCPARAWTACRAWALVGSCRLRRREGRTPPGGAGRWATSGEPLGQGQAACVTSFLPAFRLARHLTAPCSRTLAHRARACLPRQG